MFNDNITNAMKQLVSHCLDQQQNKLYYCIKDLPDTRGSLYGLLNCENGGLDCHVITKVYKPRVYYIHMYHLFCNALVHVIYSGVSGQCSHTITLANVTCLHKQYAYFKGPFHRSMRLDD